MKPNNIFIDPSGDVKIGDFGLATYGDLEGGGDPSVSVDHQPAAVSADEKKEAVNAGNADRTTGVGTFFYTSPEQERGVHGGASGSTSSEYDGKSDIFSLGIIFFEMWYGQFTTAHERFEVLTDLRQNHVFPEGFELSHPRQCQIIRWLLQGHPDDRPSALELLRSDLLPPKMEDEYMKDALRTIANPHTSFYQRLMNALFDLSRPLPVQEKVTASAYMEANFDALSVKVRRSALADLESVFERHGGVCVKTPIMSYHVGSDPILKELHIEQKEAAYYMDRYGVLMKMRFDHRVPFARLVIDKNIHTIKRFHIGKVYRSAESRHRRSEHNLSEGDRSEEKSGGGGTSASSTASSESFGGGIASEIWQADFDVVHVDTSPSASLVADAEALALMCNSLTIPSFHIIHRSLVIHINHRDIADAVLNACKIPNTIVSKHSSSTLSASASSSSVTSPDRGAPSSSSAVSPDKKRTESVLHENIHGSVRAVLQSAVRVSWEVTARMLLAIPGITQKHVNRLSTFFQLSNLQNPFEPDDCSEAMEGAFRRLRDLFAHNNNAMNAIAHIERVLEYVKYFGITPNSHLDDSTAPVSFKFVLNPTAFGENYFSGVIFRAYILEERTLMPRTTGEFPIVDKAVLTSASKRGNRSSSSDFISLPPLGLERECIAVGGRYDRLLNMLYENKRQVRSQYDIVPRGVGISIALHKLKVCAIKRAAQYMKILRSHNTQNGPSLSTHDDVSVFIVSVGNDGLKKRLRIVGELWDVGVRALFSPDEDATLEQQLSMASDKNSDCNWLVTVKDKVLASTGMVKVKNLVKNTEADVSRSELQQFFLTSKKSR